ncbi:hypothetical protein PC9H_003100 [Pleurotus ostreatus]|uniref:Uncharacterized protein n=3 Tax=Pleurotus TaxID=5320 RepID=A0A067P656_PLEO1|nr:uncharacterized protein PC9H_003100 [Pleurotus ostreatus]KAF7436271.1 hypothetical protein PC9H_003100 [Pleurotus ostreatus]KAG9222298.1 hypothetical protein CCMSSC00406_0006595 [Pleurotus cornucopiae]KDQ31346.1 hypothetical protein PLEOSDRAFT_1070494 [Pleurotus ostreatus PC15]
MSSYNYAAPTAAPAYGIFPAGQTSPNAFAAFHQSPRDMHNMYASFGAASTQSGQSQGQSGVNSLKKLVSRK